MQQDHWGYPLSTNSAEAAAGFVRGLQSFSRWQTDMMVYLDQAIESDPDFAMPYVIKGIVIATLRKPQAMPKARAMLDAAKKARPCAHERERLYIAALEAACDGRLNASVSAYETIARACPFDLFALRQSQLELFWMGEVDWMRDITESAAPHWSPDVPGFAHFQALRAFGLEETIDYKTAEKCGRDAVERDPAEVWGAHAVAHVLIMQARLNDGVDWIKGLTGQWDGCNHIVHHNWWHLALFHTERGDFEAALDIYDNTLRDLTSPLMQAMPDYFVDLQNDAAILQRLEFQGVKAGERWQDVADLANGWINNPMSTFTSPHAVLALAAAGRNDDADRLIQNLEDSAADGSAGDLAPKILMASLPACHAAKAFRHGDHRTVVEQLFPARRQLWHMGGSHAQRDLFFQILCRSLHTLGDHSKLALVVHELDTLGFEHMDERTSYRAMLSEAQLIGMTH